MTKDQFSILLEVISFILVTPTLISGDVRRKIYENLRISRLEKSIANRNGCLVLLCLFVFSLWVALEIHEWLFRSRNDVILFVAAIFIFTMATCIFIVSWSIFLKISQALEKKGAESTMLFLGVIVFVLSKAIIFFK